MSNNLIWLVDLLTELHLNPTVIYLSTSITDRTCLGCERECTRIGWERDCGSVIECHLRSYIHCAINTARIITQFTAPFEVMASQCLRRARCTSQSALIVQSDWHWLTHTSHRVPWLDVSSLFRFWDGAIIVLRLCGPNLDYSHPLISPAWDRYVRGCWS